MRDASATGRGGIQIRMSLREEIEQSRPFSSVQEEALLSIFVTGDLLSRGINAMLRDYDLTLPQYNVLRILRGAGPEGLPLMTVARRMLVRFPNVTRLTDRLETEGLMRRERSTKDRRVVRAYITREGLKVLARINGKIERTTMELMRGADPGTLTELVRILGALRAPLRNGHGNGDSPPGPEENGK